MADSFGYRSIDDRNEELHQDYTGRPREIALRRYADIVQGKTQEALGRQIVRNTPGDIELAAIREKYPSMTKGVPLDQLHELWKLLQNDNNNVARITDSKKWSPRDFPDQGLAYRPKDIDRELEDARTPQAISAPRGVDPRQPGFTMNYQPTPQAKALGNVIAALQDERLGMVPGMGTIRGLGRLRGLFERPNAGGFNVPTSQMLKSEPSLKHFQDAHRPLDKSTEIYNRLGFDADQAREIANTRLPGPRQGYLDHVEDTNSIARQMIGLDKSKLPLAEQKEFFEAYSKPQQNQIMSATRGQNALHQDVHIRPFMQSSMEGVPPIDMLRRFGFVDTGAAERAEINKILREGRRSWLSER